MRPRPVFCTGQPGHAISRAGHAERQEKPFADRVGKRPVRRLRQYFAGGVKSDILISVAGAGQALQRRGGKSGAHHARVFAVFQLFVIGIFGKAGLVRKQLRQRHLRFCAAGQTQRRLPAGNRTLQIERTFARQRSRQRACYGLGNRGPAKHRVWCDRDLGRFVRDAIGANEAHFARPRQPPPQAPPFRGATTIRSIAGRVRDSRSGPATPRAYRANRQQPCRTCQAQWQYFCRRQGRRGHTS